MPLLQPFNSMDCSGETTSAWDIVAAEAASTSSSWLEITSTTTTRRSEGDGNGNGGSSVVV
jgi:hypothetical protein